MGHDYQKVKMYTESSMKEMIIRRIVVELVLVVLLVKNKKNCCPLSHIHYKT